MGPSRRIYLQQNVLEAALDRIGWVFDHFRHVYVNFSGGKDSTVVLNLALRVARERGRLPLPVVFIDQEAEWQATIDYMRQIMWDSPPGTIEPLWLQVPFRIFNATSVNDPWLHCWDPAARDRWIRPKEERSIHENVFGTDRFSELFSAMLRHRHPDEPAVNLAGVRAEESPARTLGLTTYETWGGETWGKKEDARRNHFAWYPIYDWTYGDVWKAIHDHGWPYCRLYDLQYQYGVPVRAMRVSNVHHETAVTQLQYLQEFERDTWERVTARLHGVNTVKHMQEQFFGPRKLPPMFASWAEYRDYLVENLIEDPEHRAYYHRTFAQTDALYAHDPKVMAALYRTEIAMVLVNDHHGTKLASFHAAHIGASKNRGRRSGRVLHDGRTEDEARRAAALSASHASHKPEEAQG